MDRHNLHHEHDEGYACSFLEREENNRLLKMINCSVGIKTPASKVGFLLKPFPKAITAVRHSALFVGQINTGLRLTDKIDSHH